MNKLENLSMTAFLEKAGNQLQQDLPFVLYNKPNSNQLIGLFQQNNNLYFVDNYDEVGFIFAPFKGKNVLIPENQSEIIIVDFEIDSQKQSNFNSRFEEDIHAKNQFTALVEKALATIESGQLMKVVVSRKESIELSYFDAIILFQRLLNEYPTAFTYCFFHPKVGLWLGAFSEQLLKVKNAVFQTAAVAGTQLYESSKNIIWKNKEKQEQQLVTDFILEKLENVISNCTISEPYTILAGNVVHLKTEIKGVLNSNSNLKEVVALLHPTPAVCGLPIENAKKFILENEKYDRAYYSGFLGEINKDFSTQENSTDMYVNLRCVKIENNQANIYVGSGITKDSIPENEWIETINKSMAIKKILDLGI